MIRNTQRKMMRVSVVAIAAALYPGVAAACEFADVYLENAEAAAAEYRDADRIRNLQRAAESCDRARYWLALGDAIYEMKATAEPFLELDPDDPADGYLYRASRAYATANELARTREEIVDAVVGWARVAYFFANDPQRAYEKLSAIESLARGDERVERLSERLQTHIDKPTPQELTRALRQTTMVELAPSRIDDIPGADVNEGVVPESRAGQGGSGPGPRDFQSPVESGRTINQNVTFLFGSERVNPESLDDVRTLAAALASDELSGNRFLIIAHADARGSAIANLALSQGRAVTIARQLEVLEPSLVGRLTTEGRGERDLLIRDAETEREHRRNRRLEVHAL